MNIFLNEKYLLVGIVSALILEFLSFIQFFIPSISLIIGIFAVFMFTAVAYFHYYNAISLLFIELALSGHGHMLNIPINDFPVSIRHVWFILLIIFFLYHFRRNIKEIYIRYARYGSIVVALVLTVLYSLVIGFFAGNTISNIFNDANAYAFLLLFFPIMLLPSNRVPQLISVLLGALVILSFKTVLTEYIFSHGLFISSSWYFWVRDLRFGEITNIGFNFYRIFFQSHILLVPALFLLLARVVERYIKKIKFNTRENRILTLLGVVFFSAFIISFSRSFILGTFITLPLFFLIINKRKDFAFKDFVRVVAIILSIVIISLNVIFYTLDKPFAGELSLNRFSFTNDAAVDSRWSLLVPMKEKILDSPVFGSGFGTLLTYTSKDPRIIAQTGGAYTTFAFEWGWFDMWIKMGAVGLILIALFFTE